jgi:hypothetical protein
VVKYSLSRSTLFIENDKNEPKPSQKTPCVGINDDLACRSRCIIFQGSVIILSVPVEEEKGKSRHTYKRLLFYLISFFYILNLNITCTHVYIHGGLCARWQIYDLISGDKGRLIRQGGGGIIQCALTVYRLSTLKKRPATLIGRAGTLRQHLRFLRITTFDILYETAPQHRRSVSWTHVSLLPPCFRLLCIQLVGLYAHCVCIQLSLSLLYVCMFVAHWEVTLSAGC